jgi:muconolactone delta-isomerase
MEFLVTMTIHVPEGTPAAEVDDVRAREDLARAFDEAGLAERLRLSEQGTWIPLSR